MAIRIYAHRQNKTQRQFGLARPLRNLIYKKNFNPGTALRSPAFGITDRPLHKAPYVSCNILRHLFYILTLMLLVVSCNTSTKQDNQPHAKFDTLPLPIDSTIFYFKIKAYWKDTTNNALDTFVNTWYSKMLFALREPIIKDYHGRKEIYRFTWLRSFHHPVSIRLERQDDIIKLFTKVSNGAGGYEPRELLSNNEFAVTLQEYTLLLEKVADTKFWDLPTEIPDGSSDGAEWIVEIYKNNIYHLVARQSPLEENDGNFRIIGEYLISLSKLDKKETEHFY